MATYQEEFQEACEARREAYKEYERLNRHWWSMFRPAAHRSHRLFMEALEAQNDAHEHLNDFNAGRYFERYRDPVFEERRV